MHELLAPRQAWVLSGSSDSWGNPFIRFVDLAVFLRVPTEIRLARLREREARRGLADDDFLEWASHYDDGIREGRSLPRHEVWLKTLRCPVLRVDRILPVAALVDQIVAAATM